MNKKIVSLLIKKKLTLSIAESCTGGLLSSAITSVSGSSKVFSMGLVTYSNRAKIKVLGVSKKIIKKYGAVSHQCCLAMVKNLHKLSNSYPIEQQVHYIFIKKRLKISEFPIPTVYDGQISRIPPVRYVLTIIFSALYYLIFI